MPPPKKKSRGKNSTITARNKRDALPDSSNTQFGGFVEGLLATSSPGPPGAQKAEERFRMLLNMLEERFNITKDAINLRLEPLIAEFEKHPSLKNAVWEGGDFVEVTQSLLDGAIKAEQMSCHGVSSFENDQIHKRCSSWELICAHRSEGTARKKVTWASGTQESTRLTAGSRRSRSVEPRCTPAQPINKTRRPSSQTRSRSELKLQTPSFTRHFEYNIATVTPHPNQNKSTNGPPIYRKPMVGETAVSMYGSPLLVSTDHLSVPSVTVPLADGRVFNVQGNTHALREQLREGLNTETIAQLREIKEFINELVP